MALPSVSDTTNDEGLEFSAQKQNHDTTVAKEEAAKKAKRTKSPGVRLVGNTIYDSTNGITCHQCRQKTRAFAASCKNPRDGKPCVIKYCHKCLKNRYGEIAEEVDLINDWKCPKCRGFCNCSCCMKKRGQNPTGQLTSTAKASGFKSVSEMLKVSSPTKLEKGKANDVAVSPMKGSALKKELAVVISGEPDKENSLDESSALKLDSPKAQKELPKKSRKTKREGLKEISNGKDTDDSGDRSSKRPKVRKEALKTEGTANDGTRACKEVHAKEKEMKVGQNDGIIPVPIDGPEVCGSNDTFLDQNQSKAEEGIAKYPNVRTGAVNIEREEIQVEVPLPTGTMLTNVADIEFEPEDVGNALQFLEFCRTFGKVFDVKKGEGEAILRELVRKQTLRRGQNTLAVQFQIRVLTQIQIDSGIKSPSLSIAGGKNHWLKALEDVISESGLVSRELPADILKDGISGYCNLELSTKLQLLNFLCDEALCTAKLRTYIDDLHVRFAEEKKEAKCKVAAAKDKKKGLQQKLRDEVANAVVSNGDPLSVAEHDALVSKIMSEAAQAHAEVLEAKGIVPQGKQNCDAIRTEPVFLDGSGRAFWKLKSYGDEDAILLQDIKMEDATAAKPDESWLVYDLEKKEEVEKYISSRAARPRIRNVTPLILNESNEANM